MKQAMLDGYCKVPFEVAGETVLLEGRAALNVWQENDQRGVSFPVNVPSAAILLATRKDAEGQFVVDGISTDGGSIPRNVIVSSGLALVRYGALTLKEFVLKTSYNPARMLGMVSKGHLGANMDADVTVLDRGKAVMGLALGRIIMVDGLVVGNRGTILTTEKGVDAVTAARLPSQTIDLNQCGLYA
jgi:predicted amidohydrolase